MRLIFGTDSLNPPLTGIGRYAYELASGLVASESFEELLGYDLGMLQALEQRVAQNRETHTSAGQVSGGMILRLRQQLARSSVATRLFAKSFALFSGRQLRDYPQHIFHSPNFFLPRVMGPSVVTVHDLTYKLFPQYHPAARVAWMNSLVPRSVGQAHRIICVSEATRMDLLQAYPVDPDKVSVIYPGVSSSYRPREANECREVLQRHGLGYGSYVLSVATLEPRKNLTRLLDAYLGLSRELRQAHPLVLVGAGGWSSRDLCERIARACDEGVRYLDYVPEDELPVLYSGASCFVYPSLYEGFGLPLLEAQASGVPVVAANNSSLSEVANPCSALVDAEDTAGLGEAVSCMLLDDSLRLNCIKAGLEHAALFTWGRCVAQTIDFYRTI